MKKFSKRLFTSLVAFCMLFSVSAVPAFAAETTTEITDTQQPVVIGEYDGYLTDVMISDGVTKRAVANVRINSYATYDEDDGIQVHVKLYVPWYESPKPEFTGMTGTVNVLMNKKSTNTAFAELADGEETIETDVDTGRTGNSGDKGTVSREVLFEVHEQVALDHAVIKLALFVRRLAEGALKLSVRREQIQLPVFRFAPRLAEKPV